MNLLLLIAAILPHDAVTNHERGFSFVPVFASKDCERAGKCVTERDRCSQPIARKAATVLCTTPVDPVARESVDLIEVNAMYDDSARLVFDQLLFYDWSHDDGRYQLRAWRMVKWQTGLRQSPTSHQLPRLNNLTQRYECRWMDGEVERVITAGEVRWTATMFDPELTERDHLPKEKRKELRKPVAR
jgi:hypothetical protein